MLAIIPARGGSKGIPGKNIKPLCGKPLIAYTIEAALSAKNIDRIIVSTDDKEIAQVAHEYRAEVPFMRPGELAQDDSRAIDNYLYTIEKLNMEFHNNYKEFVVLLPTTPLRISSDIDRSIELFVEKKADSVISCAELHHPIEWICTLDQHGAIQRNEEVETARMLNRQETKRGYVPNGAVYVFTYSLIKEKHSYYSDRTYAYVMPAERSVDIDSMDEFRYVEYLMERR